MSGRVAAVAASPSPKAGGKQTYRWKAGSRFKGGRAAAQAAGEVIVRLARRHRRVTPALVLSAAAPANSVIHDHFTWNNTEAANKCRLQEAAKLLRSVVVSTTVAGQQRELRVVVTGQVQGTDDEEGYVELAVALSDPAMRSQVIARAETEMEAFIAKYEQFKQFARVIAAMKSALSKKRKKRGK
jgi:hypothetical protein